MGVTIDVGARMCDGGKICIVDIAQCFRVFEALMRITQCRQKNVVGRRCVIQWTIDDGHVTWCRVECMGTTVQKPFDFEKWVVVLDVTQNFTSETACPNN